MTTGQALGDGLTLAINRWPATLALFGARAAVTLSSLGLALWALFALKGAPGQGELAALGGLLCTSVLGQLGRVAIIGGALRQAAASLSAREVPPLATALVGTLRKSITAFGMIALVEVWVACFTLLTVLVTSGAYAVALWRQSSGVLASAALAFALCLTLLLTLATRLWLELFWVKFVHRDLTVTQSLVAAFADLLARPGVFLGIAVITGVMAFTADAIVSSIAAGSAPALGWPPSAAGIIGRLSPAVISAFVLALLDLTRLYAVLSVEMRLRAPPATSEPPPSFEMPGPGPEVLH